MAAGIGSRFGGGIKQLEPVDNNNHIIMDYSIHDAIEAGFNHVVFIIRRDIEEEFKEVIGERIAGICEKHGVTVDYAFQDINDIPGALPEGRTKPWGRDDSYFCRSFFPEEKMDYTKNQASWTLLYKKKRNLIDGSEHILYDRLKKDVK